MPNTPHLHAAQLGPHFPQEIIDNIISELSSDEVTLKQCSTVSRSFRAPSRRHLFFFIDLCTCQMVDKLHRLLIHTPDIARNIRKLQLKIRAFGAIPTEYEKTELLELYTNNTALADILGMLPCLAVFIWEIFIIWEDLPSNFRSAVVKLFQCPTLTTVVMRVPYWFPLSTFHHSPIKRLEISYPWCLDVEQGQVILPHLEMLKIGSGEYGDLGQVQLRVPNLQYISFYDHDDGYEACAFVQTVINASARSLKRLWWSYDYSPISRYRISLKQLCNLQFLTIVTHPPRWGRNFQITDVFRDTSITQTLKELTIVISFPVFERNWRYIYGSTVWKNLDRFLAPLSTLQRVLMHFEISGLDFGKVPAEYVTGMQGAMPLLAEREILIFKYGYVFPESFTVDHDI